MRIAKASLESISAYSQSRYHNEERIEKESADDYEKRTWRLRLHVDRDGHVFIPPMQFKKAIDAAAALLSEKIKGRGAATYAKHFKSGILVNEGLVLPLRADDVPGEWLMMDAKGGTGRPTSRVPRCYPVIREWAGVVEYLLLDDMIPKDVFERHLKESGNFAGIGRFRPAVGGFYGRFVVKAVQWALG